MRSVVVTMKQALVVGRSICRNKLARGEKLFGLIENEATQLEEYLNASDAQGYRMVCVTDDFVFFEEKEPITNTVNPEDAVSGEPQSCGRCAAFTEPWEEIMCELAQHGLDNLDLIIGNDGEERKFGDLFLRMRGEIEMAYVFWKQEPGEVTRNRVLSAMVRGMRILEKKAG